MITTSVHYPPIRRGRRIVLEEGVLHLENSPVGLIGANGAGKSTLLLGMAGVLRGGWRVRRRMTDLPPLALLPQEVLLPRFLTVGEVLQLYAAGNEIHPDLRSAIEQWKNTRVSRLSGGQRQLVGIAATLGSKEPLILLDEPFSALDMVHRRAALDAIRRDAARRMIVVSSQVPSDLLDVCSWFVVLRHGRIVFQGSMDDLLDTTDVSADGDPLAKFESVVLSLLRDN